MQAMGSDTVGRDADLGLDNEAPHRSGSAEYT